VSIFSVPNTHSLTHRVYFRVTQSNPHNVEDLCSLMSSTSTATLKLYEAEMPGVWAMKRNEATVRCSSAPFMFITYCFCSSSMRFLIHTYHTFVSVFVCMFLSYKYMLVFVIHLYACLYVFLSYMCMRVCMRVFVIHLYAWLYACLCHTFVCLFLSYMCMRVCMRDCACFFHAFVCVFVCVFLSYICMRVCLPAVLWAGF